MMAHKRSWPRRLFQLGFVCLFGGALVACNLGQQAPSEPFDAQSLSLTPATIPQDSGQTVTETPFFIAPTETPVPELLPQEEIRWIRLDDPDSQHRTQEPLTIRVRRGRLVSTVTCSWVLQGAEQTGALGTPTTEEVNADLVDEVYIFTPQIAGTYSVNCTGIATTSSGQRQVTQVSPTFEVAAKG
jgi:hypothetical protein